MNPQATKENKGETKSLSPQSKEACNSSCTTLITKIATERAEKDHGKKLHELMMHVPKELAEGEECKPPFKLLHAGITFKPQRTRVRRTQA
jgi:hypothetical protein